MKTLAIRLSLLFCIAFLLHACEQPKELTPTAPEAVIDDESDLPNEIRAMDPRSRAGAYKLYMAPYGNDSKNGLSAANAVKTLSRIQSILKVVKPNADVEVHIAPGIYYGQEVVWTYVHPKKITFTPVNFTKLRPVFDGLGKDKWFRLAVSSGKNTNLYFRYIKVQNYWMAMHLHGNRNNPGSGWNGNNHLYGMYFYRIGSKYSTTNSYSPGMVDLVNSRNNTIVNSHFYYGVNSVPSQYSAFHALYFAHHSSGNQVLRNRIERISGDPMRIRDLSNYNKIKDNRFIRAGAAAFYSDWYCTGSACTKPGGECPSYGNEFRNNDCYRGFYNSYISLFKAFGSSSYCGATPAPWLRTSGNTNQ